VKRSTKPPTASSADPVKAFILAIFGLGAAWAVIEHLEKKKKAEDRILARLKALIILEYVNFLESRRELRREEGARLGIRPS